MRRIVAILALALLSVLVFASASSAQEPTGDITVFDTEVTIRQGDDLSIWYFWAAGSPGTVRAAIRGLRDTIEITTVEGTSLFYAGPEDTAAFWGPIVWGGYGSDEWYPRVANSSTPVCTAAWIMDLPTAGLAPGLYVIHYSSEATHLLVDLGDWDGDGKHDPLPAGPGGENDILLTVE